MKEKFTVNCAVFDGEKVYENATVTVENGIIVSLEEGCGKAESDLFLMPGLIDGHAHISQPQQLDMLVNRGVTTVCDVSVSKEIRDMGHKINIHTSHISAKGDCEDGAGHVEKTIAAGGDFIKLFIEIPPAMAPRTIPADILADIVDTAHQKGLKVISHAASVPAQQMAIDAGVDILLHTAMRTATPKELVQQVLDKKLAFMPTILMMKEFTIEPFRDYEEIGFEYACNAVKLFYDMGVPVLVGTDANDSKFVPAIEHGSSMAVEMEMLADCGIPALDVLKGATSLNADVFGMENIGRIAPGKKADFILVKGRPDKNISDIRNIEKVYIDGEQMK